MKKLFMLLLVIAIIGFVAAPAIASPLGSPAGWVPSAEGKMYDINRDGVFNYADINTFYLCYGHKSGQMGWRCYTGQFYQVGMPYYRGDVTLDGKVDFKDLTWLMKKVRWYQANGWWQ